MTAWTNDLAVGIPEIDSQHQELFRQLDHLAWAMSAGGAARSDVERIVRFLAHYVVDHFTTEESLMDRHEYPAAGHHKFQHQVFAREVAAFEARLDQGPVPASAVLGLHRKITDWLTNHIGKTDAVLGTYLKARMTAV